MFLIRLFEWVGDLSMGQIPGFTADNKQVPGNRQSQCLGTFLGIIGQIPSVSNSKVVHVVIFQFSLIDSRHIP